jgi:hypothetical protein
MPMDALALAQRAAGFESVRIYNGTTHFGPTYTLELNIGSNGRDHIIAIGEAGTANRVGCLDRWDEFRRCAERGF